MEFTIILLYLGDVNETIGLDMTDEISRSLMFVFILNVFNTVTNFPFSVYSTFVLEEKHGFNKQTPMFYIKDQVGYYS